MSKIITKPVKSIDDWAYNLAVNIHASPNIDVSANIILNIRRNIIRIILMFYEDNDVVRKLISDTLSKDKSFIEERIIKIEPICENLLEVQRWKPSRDWLGKPVMVTNEQGKYVSYKDYLALVALIKNAK